MNTKRDFPQLDMLLSRSSLTASRYCIAHLTFILFDDEKKSAVQYTSYLAMLQDNQKKN